MAFYYQNAPYRRGFWLFDSTTHASPVANVSTTITLSKQGASFVYCTGTVTTFSNGYYSLGLTTTDTNTIGSLAFNITGTGVDTGLFEDYVLTGVQVATNNDKTDYLLTTGNRGEIISAVWATPTRTLTAWSDIVNAVWATPVRITTSVASPVAVASNYDKVNYTATTASLTEGADVLLARNVSGGSSAGRTVKQALHALRNKVDLLGGIVYDTDDATTSWTFTVASDTSSDRVIAVDPS